MSIDNLVVFLFGAIADSESMSTHGRISKYIYMDIYIYKINISTIYIVLIFLKKYDQKT